MKRKLTPQTHALDAWKVQIQQWRFSTCLMVIILAFCFNVQQLAAQAPLAVCQNLTRTADGNCQAVVVAADFDGGSTDPNGDSLIFSVSPAGPYALGTSNVTLSVSDGSSTTTCLANITVTDQSPPVPTAGTPPPTDWDEVIKATASNAGAGDEFAWSVSISGDRAIVGARYEDGINNNMSNAGAAYIFEKNAAGNWVEVAQLQASNAGSGDWFGLNVSISGDKAIVGAWGEDGISSNINYNSGAAYVFEKNAAGNWVEVDKLQASNAEADDRFGYSVSISGDKAIVGAYAEDTGGSRAGTAYIFEKNGASNWLEVEKIQASDKQALDYFGLSVSISGDKVIVGAWYEDGITNSMPDAGAAYIFEKNAAGNWVEVDKLQASNAGTDDQFGTNVSISGDKAIVGARYEDGINNNMSNAGAAYIFEKNVAGNWVEVDKLQASNVGARVSKI